MALLIATSFKQKRMNTGISQKEKSINWNADDRLVELPVKYVQPAAVRIKVNKSMMRLSWKDIEDSIEQLIRKIKASGFLPDYMDYNICPFGNLVVKQKEKNINYETLINHFYPFRIGNCRNSHKTLG